MPSGTSGGAREKAEWLATDSDRGPCNAPAAPPTFSPEPGSADEDDLGAAGGKFLSYCLVWFPTVRHNLNGDVALERPPLFCLGWGASCYGALEFRLPPSSSAATAEYLYHMTCPFRKNVTPSWHFGAPVLWKPPPV